MAKSWEKLTILRPNKQTAVAQYGQINSAVTNRA